MNLVAAPVIAPLLTAVVMLALTDRLSAQRRVGIVSALAVAAVVAWLVAQTARDHVLVLPLGGWSPFVGIAWVVDRLSATMLSGSAILSLATLAYASPSLRAGEARTFYPLHQLMVAGVNGSLVTGDLFNLFVFFEVMLVASFVLMSLGGRAGQLTREFPYVLVNLVASGFLLFGAGLVYATSGTVDFAVLAVRIDSGALPPSFWAGLSLCLVVFAIKSAVLPFVFWLPDSYPEAPLAISALLAGLLTKVGIYALYRVVPLLGPNVGGLQDVLVALGAATMIVGVVGALGQSRIRGILSFHIVSQVGYMVFALGLLTPLSVAAGILFTFHNMLAKPALFLAGGIPERVAGSQRLEDVSGIAVTFPWAGAAFFVPAMALAGIPPLSGFWGKLLIVYAGFREGACAATAVAVVVSLLTLASMLKIWVKVYWGAPRGQVQKEWGRAPGLVGPALVLGGLVTVVGLAVAPLWTFAEAMAAQLLGRAAYVDAVLGTLGTR